MTKKKEIPIMVTTSHRGVFFGYVSEKPTKKDRSLCLRRARNCISWSSDMKGFLGLASIGPSKTCRIGPQVDEFLVSDITSIAVVPASAAAAWESAPWS